MSHCAPDARRTVRFKFTPETRVGDLQMVEVVECVCVCLVSDRRLLAEILASRDSPPNSTSAVARQVV